MMSKPIATDVSNDLGSWFVTQVKMNLQSVISIFKWILPEIKIEKEIADDFIVMGDTEILHRE